MANFQKLQHALYQQQILSSQTSAAKLGRCCMMQCALEDLLSNPITALCCASHIIKIHKGHLQPPWLKSVGQQFVERLVADLRPSKGLDLTDF